MNASELREERRNRLMEQCFQCYCENGLTNTSRKALEKACGMTGANLYTYFNSVDDMIVESTAYCMSQVEDEFMALAPTNIEEAVSFFRDIPYWTAEKHGSKYRFMYQVYSNPKFIEEGTPLLPTKLAVTFDNFLLNFACFCVKITIVP